MQKRILFIGLALMMTITIQLKAQYTETDNTFKKWFVGSNVFILVNLTTTNSPDFAQYHFGYLITEKDVITLQPKTWKNVWPNFRGIFGSMPYQ